MIAERSYEDLYLYRKEEQSKHVEFWEDELVLGKTYIFQIENEKQMQVTFYRKDISEMKENNQKKLCTKCFDYDKMGIMPIFRYPRSGDYMWIDANGHTKKISRIFIDGKIPAAQRKETPVLAIGDHIVWIPLLGRVSPYYYLTESTTRVLCAQTANNERLCMAK